MADKLELHVMVCCSDFPANIPVLCRSLSSKVVSQYSNLLSPMAVDSVLRVLDPQRTS